MIVSLLNNAALVSSSSPGYQSLGCKLEVTHIVLALSTTAEPLTSTRTGYRSNQRKICEIEIVPLNSSITTLSPPW